MSSLDYDRTLKLRDFVSKIGSGLTPKGGSKVYSKTGIPLIRSQNVLTGRLTLEGVARIPSGIHEQMSASSVCEGDVLLNITGASIGRSCVVPHDTGEANVNQHVCIIRPIDGLDPHFLSQFLNSYQGQKQIWSFQGGGSREGLNFDQVGSFKIPDMDLASQRKIAEILRTWDEALEKLTALRAAKARRFEGLRDKLIAAASRTGHPALFGDFLTESREPGTDGATARKISVRLYGKGAVEKVDARGGSANTRYYRRSAGQLIWSKLDFLNGAFALLGPELDGCESTLDLPAFDCSDAVNPIWLIEYLTRPAYYTRQIHLARGQRKARRVSPEDWLASPVRRPDRTTQDKIAGALSTGRTELALLDAEIEALTRQKRGLMQKLLTGEWRVNLKSSQKEFS